MLRTMLWKRLMKSVVFIWMTILTLEFENVWSRRFHKSHKLTKKIAPAAQLWWFSVMRKSAGLCVLNIINHFTVAHNFACPANQETRGPHVRWLWVSERMHGRWVCLMYSFNNRAIFVFYFWCNKCRVNLFLFLFFHSTSVATNEKIRYKHVWIIRLPHY